MPLYLRESEGRNDTDDRTNFFFFFFIVHLIILSSQLKKLLHAAHSTLPNAFNPTIIFLISKFTNALEFNSKTPRLIPTRATTSFEIPHRRLNPSNQRDYSSLDPSKRPKLPRESSKVFLFSLFPFFFLFFRPIGHSPKIGIASYRVYLRCEARMQKARVKARSRCVVTALRFGTEEPQPFRPHPVAPSPFLAAGQRRHAEPKLSEGRAL